MTTRRLLASKKLLGSLAGFPLSCPLCGHALLHRAPKKTSAELRCKCCNTDITASAAHKAALEHAAQEEALALELAAFEDEAAVKTARLHKLPHIRLLTRRFLLKRLDVLKQELLRIRSQLVTARTRKQECVTLEYYLSPWYQGTHLPAAQPNQKEEARGLIPLLEATQVKAFASSEKDIGAAGEHLVYQLLKNRSEEFGSPLYGSAVLPREMIRWATRESGQLKIHEREIDCLVATPSCLFLVEVKTIDSHILASSSQERIASSKQAEVPQPLNLGANASTVVHRPFKKDKRILPQSTAGSEAVLCSSWPYPGNRIRRVIVFAEPRSFTNEDCGFCGNLFIGCVVNGRQSFIGAMERESAAHNAFVTLQELERFGGEGRCDLSIVQGTCGGQAA